MARHATDMLVAGTLAVVVAMPLGFVLLQAVFPDLPEGSLRAAFAHWGTVASDPLLPELVANTLWLGFWVCAASAGLAVPLAFVRGLFDLPFARIWDVLFLIPFMTPPYVGAMAWTFALQPGGYASQLVGVSAAPLLFSFPGMVLVMALHLFPLVYFALSRALATIGWRHVDVARVCGASVGFALRRVVLPLCMPALAASLLLVFAMAIEEYGTPAILGRPSQYLVLVTRIEEKFADWPIDLPGAAMLSLVLLALALAAFGLHDRIATRRSYTTVTGKSAGSFARLPLGRWRLPALAAFAATGLCAVVLPVGAMLATAFSETLSGGLRPENLGLRHFRAVFADGGGALGALLTSWGLASVTAVAAGALGALAAYVGVRSAWRGRKAVDALAALPNALPAMVLAVGLILCWNRGFWPVQVYNTAIVLVLAYVCLLLPYPVRYVSAALRQIGESMDGAARVSGAGTARLLARILVPLVAPQLFVAMLLVFAIASRELVASVMLAPPGMATVSTFIFNQFAQGAPGEGMALAAVAIGLSTALLVALAGRASASTTG